MTGAQNDANCKCRQAIIAYLCWEGVKKQLQDGSLCLRETLGRLKIKRDELERESCDELKSKASDKMTLFIRVNSWKFERIPGSKLGTVMPYVGDIPTELLCLPLDCIAERISSDFRLRNYNSTKYVLKLAKLFAEDGANEIIHIVPPIAVSPASLQRNMQNASAVSNCNVFIGDAYLEDGNHRALAYLIGRKTRQLEVLHGTVS